MMNARYVPNNAKEIKRNGINGVVYAYEGESGTPYAVAYSGKRGKPDFHYRFGNVEKRSEAIEAFFKGIESRYSWKRERKARTSAATQKRPVVAGSKPATGAMFKNSIASS